MYQNLQSLFANIQSVFANFEGSFFSEEELKSELNKYLNDDTKSEKISKFILSSYSGRLIQPGVIEANAFLQQRREIDGNKYRIFNNQYCLYQDFQDLRIFRIVVGDFWKWEGF